MHLTRLDLQQFRNFREASFHFEPGVNCVWGANGAGKSNLLEAVFFAATGRPSKATRDGELIRFSEPVARVEGRVTHKNSEIILEAALERIENYAARKILKLNRQPVRRLSELMGKVKVVLFTPNDEAMVQGEPSHRRRFLDFLLSQLSPKYLHWLQEYKSVRDQRNSLLKRAHSPAELIPWNDQLAEYGGQIIMKRIEILPRLSELAGQFHRRLSRGAEALAMNYQSPLAIEANAPLARIREAFLSRLSETREEEAARGMTLTGPHRDDLAIFINEKEGRLFGSQGQQKSAALSLKLAEGKLLENQERDTPLYLLDDCYSELDPSRQDEIQSLFDSGAQCILSFACPPPASMASFPRIELNTRENESTQENEPGKKAEEALWNH